MAFGFGTHREDAAGPRSRREIGSRCSLDPLRDLLGLPSIRPRSCHVYPRFCLWAFDVEGEAAFESRAVDFRA